MKTRFTLSAALACTLCAAAQSTSHLLHTPPPEIQALLKRPFTGQAAKTTALQERLQAKMVRYYANGNYNGGDTIHYWYNSNTRGSSFDFNALDYTSPNPWLVLTDLSVKADSAIELLDNTGQGFTPYTQTKASYTPTGRPTTVVTAINNQPERWRSTYTYDAQGHITEVLRENITNGGPWTYWNKTVFTYNTQGNVLTDSAVNYDAIQQTWTPAERTTYTYDASGINPLSMLKATYDGNGGFDPNQLFTNTFYPNNRLKTTLMSGFDNAGNAIPGTLDSFGYTGNSDYYIYYYEAEPDVNGIFQPAYLQTRHVNAQNLPDTVNVYYPMNGQWVQQLKSYFSYTSYGNPETYAYYSPIAGPQYPVIRGRYYYETYDPTSVSAITAAAQDVLLYPNPVTDMVNIRWANRIPGTAVVATLTDMQGRLVRSESFTWNEPVQRLSLAALQPGNYVLDISTGEGRELFCRQIVKR